MEDQEARKILNSHHQKQECCDMNTLHSAV